MTELLVRVPRQWIGRAAVGVIGLAMLAAAALFWLHWRSDYPGTALRYQDGHSAEVNVVIQRRTQEFMSALRAGKLDRVGSVAGPLSTRSDVTKFVAAFGGRNVRVENLEANEMGQKTADLDLVVPCKNAPERRFTVEFVWLRTSYIRSNWYAAVYAPGTSDQVPDGCPAA